MYFFFVTDLCWIHRISERWKELRHQHSEEEDGVQSGSRPWRDESVAVHYVDEKSLSHRLPGSRASHRRERVRDRIERRDEK